MRYVLKRGKKKYNEFIIEVTNLMVKIVKRGTLYTYVFILVILGDFFFKFFKESPSSTSSNPVCFFFFFFFPDILLHYRMVVEVL